MRDDQHVPVPIHHLRWSVPVAALALLGAACRSGGSPAAQLPAAQSPGALPAATGSAAPSVATDTAADAADPSPTGRSAGGYQPLWPFADAADVREWQRQHRQQGSQPWHLDAAATALSFTRGFLGITDVDRAVRTTVEGNEARVAVGYPTAPGRTATAAVIHLVKLGTGDPRPWEVVGTDDSTLTLTAPAYGAAVGATVRTGGRITGVDENVRVVVRDPARTTPVGDSCCTAAGGQSTPWSRTVTITGTTGPVLTVVATTGGHLQEVERFAVTAVRRAG